jgi:hypothetical protein
MSLSFPSTLVIILSETPNYELTFASFKKNVIDELNADLCLCIGVNSDYDYTNPFYKLSKYKFLYDKPDDFGEAFEYANRIISEKPVFNNQFWKDFLAIKNQTVSAMQIFFQWFVLKNLAENNLIHKYKRFIITRSDFVYQLPHPKIEWMNENLIWIPDGENYTYRHIVLSQNTLEPYLNILNNMVLRSSDYFGKMKNMNEWNLEKFIHFHLHQNGISQLVKEFPCIMYSLRNMSGTIRCWSKGIYHVKLGYYIKYKSDYEKSCYYKNEFEKSGLSTYEFYKKYDKNENKNVKNVTELLPFFTNKKIKKTRMSLCF